MDSRTPLQGVDIGEQPELRGFGCVIRASGRYVSVEDRLVPEWIEIDVDGDDLQPRTIGRVEVRDGAPEIVEVRFVSEPGQRQVRQADLRSFEVSALVDLVAGYAVQVGPSGVVPALHDAPGSASFDAALEAVARSRSGRAVRKVTPQFLERVAEIYRANLDDRPTQAVREHFVVGERMASEYVQRARRAGLLPTTTPGKKKG